MVDEKINSYKRSELYCVAWKIDLGDDVKRYKSGDCGEGKSCMSVCICKAYASVYLIKGVLKIIDK